jgi:dihydropteroate synthase
VTPDSFSDGGQWVDFDAAVSHGLEMLAAGAEILDVGGESTRPGAEPVPEREELRRVIPVIERLSSESDAVISIDTMKPAVARAAIAAGAAIVNDITGFAPKKCARSSATQARLASPCICKASRARCNQLHTIRMSAAKFGISFDKFLMLA